MKVVAELIGPGPDAADVLLALPPGDRVALVGDWAGGGAIVTSGAPAKVVEPVETIDTTEHGDVVGGGWFGWFGYDGTSRLAFYDHVFRLRDGQWWFEALWTDARADVLEEHRAWVRRWSSGFDGAQPAEGYALGDVVVPSRDQHLAAVEGAVERIRAGELYQVNICTRLAAEFTGDPAALFAHTTRDLNPVFGAYVESGPSAVVSLSPELFLRRRGRNVTTAPIKGTLPRTGTDENRAALRASAKDAAENVMIVDLMRNDLGRVCEIGSVRPTALLEVQPHPGVWHLVSTVTGTLRPGITDADLLDATFPPGSVTGAPKSRALTVIADLEPVPRAVYTGTIGYASPVWGAEFTVAIRTFEVRAGQAVLGVGGGITADSVPMLEWRECLHKAAPLLRAAGAVLPVDEPTEPDSALRDGGLLETVLVLDGHPLRLADHLARLDRSARELYGRGVPDGLAERVRRVAATTAGRARLRVVLSPAGEAEVSTAGPVDAPGPSDARLVRGRTGVWRHKWADRSLLSDAEAHGTPIFVADDGTVLETGRGNIFLLAADGTLSTPPLRDDLLPGITRRALLDLAHDQGRPVRLRGFGSDDLLRSVAFWTSSLSLAVPIATVDGVRLPRADDVVAHFAAALAEAVR